MQRVAFPEGGQVQFLSLVFSVTNLSVEEVASICGVHPRTIRDWRRGKYRISPSAAKKLTELSGVTLPDGVQVVNRYEHLKRFSSLGGKRRQELYGTPKNLLKHKKWIRKIRRPDYNQKLAEFFGIVLGDGCITHGQVGISVNSKTDRDYALYIKNLLWELFEVPATLNDYSEKAKSARNCIVVLASSLNLVRFLLEHGLIKGNKVKQQVAVPVWIHNNVELSKACMRGLIDTDGTVFVNDHWVGGYHYQNIELSFSNRSLPLLDFVEQTLAHLNFTPRRYGKKCVNLRKEPEVERYFKEVGTNNPKHQLRFDQFVKHKSN
jgi:transcriptional regulator with XRE-family HTH domain